MLQAKQLPFGFQPDLVIAACWTPLAAPKRLCSRRDLLIGAGGRMRRINSCDEFVFVHPWQDVRDSLLFQIFFILGVCDPNDTLRRLTAEPGDLI